MRSLYFVVLTIITSSVSMAQTVRPDSLKSQAPPAHCKSADTILLHGTLYTGVGFAEDRPQTVTAMAICDGKVLATGTDRQIEKFAGRNTVQIDLSARNVFVFPGFNDAHLHLGGAGSTWASLNLAGTDSLSAMLAKIQAYAHTLADGRWITGGNWDHTLWENKTLPTRQDLDKVTGNHPALLGRIDGHISLANTAALKAARITAKTIAPLGSAIDLDANGEPTGILRESAQGLIESILPPPTHEERRKDDEHAIEDALSHGLTSVQDYSDWQDFLIYEELEKDHALHIRITEWLPFSAPLKDLEAMRVHHDQSDPMLHTGMLKGFMDGSLGSRTAAMKAPYADDPNNSGLPQYTQKKLNAMVMERTRAGFQFGFHAIGDKATAMALNAFSQPSVSKTARNRIEHAQVVDPADIARFARLGVIASMQPSHLLTDMNWAEDRLGHNRAAYSYAWKAFWDAGVVLAFGTDYPVEPVTPFRGLYAAVTRMNPEGTKTYFPQNKLSRGQALYAYTQGPAYAEFAEQHKGKLAPGYDADFILVDHDLYRAEATNLLQTQVEETWVAGERAYKHASSKQ